MKPPPFAYDRPTSEAEALALLTEHGDEAKLLAGGQSLVPLLNFRLAFPERLIDINRIDSLSYVREGNGSLRIGAMTRLAEIERSELIASRYPMIAEAMPLIAHFQIRNRGTVGGSVAHADPAAELPTLLACLDAKVHARTQDSERQIGWQELFVTHLVTRLEPTELLTEIEIPAPPAGAGQAFIEFSRRHGDFALGGVAALIAIDEERNCTEARIALLSAASTPIRATGAEQALLGSTIDEAAAVGAGEAAIEGIEPTGDIHGSTEYRRKLIAALTERCVIKAGERASAP